jgi:hypothetical protein
MAGSSSSTTPVRSLPLSTKKDGKVSKLDGTLPVSRQFQTAAMYAPGKILTMRNNAVVPV